MAGDTVDTIKRKNEKTRKPPHIRKQIQAWVVHLPAEISHKVSTELFSGPQNSASLKAQLLSTWEPGTLLVHRIREKQGSPGSMYRLMAKERTRISQGPGAQRGLQGGAYHQSCVPVPASPWKLNEREADRWDY